MTKNIRPLVVVLFFIALIVLSLIGISNMNPSQSGGDQLEATEPSPTQPQDIVSTPTLVTPTINIDNKMDEDQVKNESADSGNSDTQESNIKVVLISKEEALRKVGGDLIVFDGISWELSNNFVSRADKINAGQKFYEVVYEGGFPNRVNSLEAYENTLLVSYEYTAKGTTGNKIFTELYQIDLMTLASKLVLFKDFEKISQQVDHGLTFSIDKVFTPDLVLLRDNDCRGCDIPGADSVLVNLNNGRSQKIAYMSGYYSYDVKYNPIDQTVFYNEIEIVGKEENCASEDCNIYQDSGKIITVSIAGLMEPNVAVSKPFELK